MARGKVAAKVGRAACPHAAEGGVLAAKNAKSAKAMKPSGVAWLGDIPEGWEVISIKEILRNVTIKDHPDARVLSLYRELGILPKDSRDDNHNVTSEDTAQYKFVRIGNVVINKMKAWQGSIGVSAYEGIVSPAYYVCEFLDNNQSPVFIHFLLRNKKLAQEFERLSTGMRVGQWDLGIDDFLRVKIPFPPLAEQKAIAAYLDEKCAAIDAAVAEAKKGIEEYKAWKKSLIFEMVTGKRRVGAFNAETQSRRDAEKMKPSGIPWIGDIPEGWRVSRVKNIANIQHGQDPKTEGSIPVYGSGDGSFKTCGEYKDGPAVLLGRKGATLHIPHYIVGRYWNVDTAFDVKMLGDANLRWFYYLAICFDYKAYMSQTTLPSMTQSDYRNMTIPIPEVSEQQAIADYLDEKCAAIDAMVAEKEALIADLEVYKKSLIYETVTGKREVA